MGGQSLGSGHGSYRVFLELLGNEGGRTVMRVGQLYPGTRKPMLGLHRGRFTGGKGWLIESVNCK